jgi:hypothetical protein
MNVFKEDYQDTYSDENWLRSGIIWGMLMFLMLEIVFPLFTGELYTFKKIMYGLLIWGLGGIFFGFVAWKFVKYTTNKHKA